MTYINLKPARSNQARLYIVKEGEEFVCPKCNRRHQKLWIIRRKVYPVTNFAGAYINGDFRAIDPTLPTDVTRIPRDAEPVDDNIATELWHREGHYFG